MVAGGLGERVMGVGFYFGEMDMLWDETQVVAQRSKYTKHHSLLSFQRANFMSCAFHFKKLKKKKAPNRSKSYDCQNPRTPANGCLFMPLVLSANEAGLEPLTLGTEPPPVT